MPFHLFNCQTNVVINSTKLRLQKKYFPWIKYIYNKFLFIIIIIITIALS